MSDRKPPRLPTGRDFQPPKSRPFDVPVLEVDEDITEKYDGEELEAARARRPTPERFRVLERKSDEHAAHLAAVDASLARITTLGETNATQLDRLIELEQARSLANVDVQAAEAKDKIAKRGSLRDAAIKLLTGGTVVELIHRIVGK
jgi:multidrug efflux pump subunit AcrA (membrane-fusion protein)